MQKDLGEYFPQMPKRERNEPVCFGWRHGGGVVVKIREIMGGRIV